MESNDKISNSPMKITDDTDKISNKEPSNKTNNTKNERLYKKPSLSHLNPNNNQLLIENQKLKKEKETIPQSLHKEMISNEEQKYYITRLQETISQNLTPSSNSHKKQNSFPNSTIDPLYNTPIKSPKTKTQSEQYKNEFPTESINIQNTKDQIAQLNKTIETLQTEKKTIKEKLQKLTEENKQLNNLITKNAKEYKKASIDLDNLKQHNFLLKEQISQYQSMNRAHDNQMQTTYKQFSLMSRNLHNSKTFETDYISLQTENNELKYNLQKRIKEQDDFKEQIDLLKAEKKKTSKTLELLEEEHQEMIKGYNDLKIKYQSALTASYQVDTLNKTLQLQKKENSNQKGIFEKMKDSYIKEINSLKLENNQLKHEVTIKEIDMQTLQKKIFSLESENKNIKDNINIISREHKEVVKENHNNKEKVNYIAKEKDECDKERDFWKEKYKDDMTIKDNDIKRMKDELMREREEKENMIRVIINIKQYNDDINNELMIKNANEEKMITDFENMKILFNELNAKYEKTLIKVKKGENDINENIQFKKDINLISYEFQRKFDINKIQNKLIKIYDIMKQSLNIIPNNYNNNFSEQFNRSLSFFNSSQSISEPIESQIENYIIASSNELLYLNRKISLFNMDIQKINEKVLQIEKETIEDKKFTEANNNIEYNDMINEINRLEKEKFDLLDEIERYKGIIEQMKITCGNYNGELDNKNRALARINYEYNIIKDNNIKLTSYRKIFEEILFRLCKVLPNNTLYNLFHDIMDDNINEEDKDEINKALYNELQKVEDYIHMIKEKSKNAINKS